MTLQQQQAAFHASHWGALTCLWRQQELCDVQLRASSGELLAAHSIVLASGSGFFRALLCGAGRSMREGCLVSNNQQQQHSAACGQPSNNINNTPQAGCSSNLTHGHGQVVVVDLPYSAQQLSVLLEVLYEHTLEVVCAHSVSWLLDMAAFLEVQPLQEACCEFLRSALCSDACVDVLLLAHHYHCTQLQAEAVSYLATRLSSLLVMPDTRQALLRLPEPLLHQLLSSEAVDVEQESELLCLLSDWVCHSPSGEARQHHLPQLLPLLKLSALPEERLSQKQLQACGGHAAAALAQELYMAAQACYQTHGAPPPSSPGQHQHNQGGSRRQAGQAVADLSVTGRCLARGSQGGGMTDAAASRTLNRPEEGSNGSAAYGASSRSSSSNSSSLWLRSLGRTAADVNNNGGSSVSLDSIPPGSPMVCSSGANGDGVGVGGNNNSADGLLPAVIDVDSRLTSSSSSSSSDSSRDSDVCGLLELCEPGRIGAVVAQAWPGRQRGHQPTSILVAGGHDPSWRGLKAVELYDPTDNTWRAGPMLPMALPFAGAGVATRGQVYVIGGAMCSNYMARLDVANEEWHNCEGPALSRLHAGVTGSAGLLYVTGGRTQVNVVVSAVEAYDHASASWTSLPDMLQPRYAHAAVAQGGCLYALGGQASKAIHRTVEVYDPQRGSWQALAAQLTNERKYCAAASVGGRLLVLGGMNEARRRLSTVEAYDPREGRWTELTSMQHARSSCSVACVGGRLYVMGGSAGNEQLHSSVEVLDPLTGQWSSCAALSCGRSGLTAVAV